MPPPSRPVKCAFQLRQLMDKPSQLVPLFLSLSASFKDPLMIRIIKDLWCEWHQGSQELILCFYSPASLHNLRTWRHTCVKTDWAPVRAAHNRNRKTPRGRLLTWRVRWNAVRVCGMCFTRPSGKQIGQIFCVSDWKTRQTVCSFWRVWNKW